MEKKLYEAPEMEVVAFEEEILLASGDDQGNIYAPCPEGDQDLYC